MPRTLDEIRRSLSSLYDPQRALVEQEKAALPGEETAAISAADAKLKLANEDIVRQANDRGVLFSGDPTERSIKYAATEYAPTIAGIKANTLSRRTRLDAGLVDIAGAQSREARDIYQGEAKAESDAAYRAEQLAIKRQAAAQKASAGRKPTRQDEIYSSFSEDLQGAFNGFAARPTFYTEKYIIPQLQAAYPELSPSKIQQLVYSFRKANFGA